MSRVSRAAEEEAYLVNHDSIKLGKLSEYSSNDLEGVSSDMCLQYSDEPRKKDLKREGELTLRKEAKSSAFPNCSLI